LRRGRSAQRQLRTALGLGSGGGAARRVRAARLRAGAWRPVAQRARARAGGLMASRRSWTRESLADGVRAGDKRALARAISLVLMPGSGDSVQALKAGIMEIPDVIAINKMDHPAAKTMLNEVRSILSLGRERPWRPPIVLTEATRDENVATLWEKIQEHRAFL